MAVSSQILQVLSGLETAFLASKNAEMLFKSLSVSADGNSNGFDISESSGSFSFNSKPFINVGSITLAAASTVSNIQDPVADKDAAPRKWVLDQIAAVGLSVDWRNSALSRVTAPPSTPASGDRYLIKATASGDFAGKEDQVAIWSGSAWSYELPHVGAWIAVDDEPTLVYNYAGSAWVPKYFELTTASGFLDQTSGVITLKNLSSGRIILGDSGNIAQAVTPTGDVTISNTGVTAIGAKKVLDSMIALAEAKVLIGDAGGAAAAQSISGDITLSAAGVAAIGAKKVLESMVALAEGKVLIGDATGAAAAQSVSGDVTISTSGVTAIGAKKVLESMVALPSGKILIGDAGGAAASQAVSGDISISASGVTAIGSAKVTEVMIAASALQGRLSGGSGTKLDVSFAESGTAAGAIAAGDLVYQLSDGTWSKAQANVASLGDKIVGVAAASIADAASGLIYVHAGCKIAGFSGLTRGQKVIVSRSSAGGYSQSLSGFVSGEYVYSIGRAYSATEVEFAPQYIGVFA